MVSLQPHISKSYMLIAASECKPKRRPATERETQLWTLPSSCVVVPTDGCVTFTVQNDACQSLEVNPGPVQNL